MTNSAAGIVGAPAPPVSSTLLTFLLADIRGYTHFSAERGDLAASQLSELFLALCREVVGAHGGEVFGSAGDQALAAFPSAHAALRSAVALQARLAEEQSTRPDLPLRAGIGLDTGEGIRVGSDYRGNAINLAARLCSIAGGGEVLASQTVVSVARVVEGIMAVDRGEVCLKGLLKPVQVLQVAPEGALPAELPPLQPILAEHPTNLPDEPTPFVGRHDEIGQITRLLGDPHVRLLTLTGPGGTGKTRLALQVGATLLHAYDDGLFLVSLAPLGDPSLVASAIAQVLQIKEEPGVDLSETLAGHLQDRHLLLVLDNFEQLPEANVIVARLLERCRHLRILVTSRSPLHLSREYEYPVPPLAVPRAVDSPGPEMLAQYDAVALFVDRAQAVKPDFALTEQNAPAVAEICERLDGLPLAIELAARRVRHLTPRMIRDRLGRRLDLLAHGASDVPARFQTLRATIDWSYDLLSQSDQRLFAQLAVFTGGCTLDGAEAVCEGIDDVLDGIASLVDKNLLRLVDRPREDRYMMLETIHMYARERLDLLGADRSRQHHAEHYLSVAAEARRGLAGPEQVAWLDRLDEEHGNLRTALEWALAHDAREAALRAGAGLWRFWETRGYLTEGRRWLERSLEGSDAVPARIRGAALNGAASLALAQGDYAVAAHAWTEVLQICRDLGHAASVAGALGNLGAATTYLGEYEQAEQLHQESLEIWRQEGNQRGMAAATGNLGLVALCRGEYVKAAQLFEETLALARSLDDERAVAIALNNLGDAALGQGDQSRASRFQLESLALFHELGDREGIARCLGTLACLLAMRGRADQAVRLWAASDRLRKSAGAGLVPPERALQDRHLTRLRDDLDQVAFQAAWQGGQAMDLDDAVASVQNSWAPV